MKSEERLLRSMYECNILLGKEEINATSETRTAGGDI